MNTLLRLDIFVKYYIDIVLAIRPAQPWLSINSEVNYRRGTLDSQRFFTLRLQGQTGPNEKRSPCITILVVCKGDRSVDSLPFCEPNACVLMRKVWGLGPLPSASGGGGPPCPPWLCPWMIELREIVWALDMLPLNTVGLEIFVVENFQGFAI